MTILCYHSVDPGWESPLSIRPEELEAHCQWIARRRTVLPLVEAVSRMDRKGRLPRGTAALTFDDGFADNLSRGWPILRRHGLPMTVFLVAQTLTDEGLDVHWVRTPPSWPLTTLTTEQVLEMHEAGVDFQSHSWAHRDLPELGFSECVEDLRRSREFLEDLLHKPIPFLAYPRGLHDERVREATEQAGYSHGFALPEGPEEPGPFAVPRVGIHRGNRPRVLAVKSSHTYLAIRHGRVGALARSALRRVPSRA